MASSQLIDHSGMPPWHNTIKLDTTRTKLYYGRYKYRATAELKGVQYFRYIYRIDSLPARLKDKVNSPEGFISWTNLDNQLKTVHSIIESMGKNCHEDIANFVSWREWSREFSDQYTLRLQVDRMDLYTNNLNVIDKLTNTQGISVTQAAPVAEYDPTVIYHKNPKHKLRIYFNFHAFSFDEADQFKELLSAYKFTGSPSLTRSLDRESGRWMNWPNRRKMFVMNDYFVDCDDESLTTILALSYGNLIRKVQRIEKK